MSQLEELIFKYFDDGFWYKEILEFLEFVHGYSLSLSSLKRILRRNNKKRRALRCSQQELSDAVERELAGSSNNVGYRRMHRILISKGIRCRREDVRKMVCDKDPEGVQLRKRRRLRRRKYLSPGPNFVWYIDGNDKLKPYCFSIHGGIDGFSRRVLWLEVSTSNKMPEIIAKYYLDAVKRNGLPVNVKADDGTEHSLVQPIHLLLRNIDGSDPNLESFSIVTSPANQRIEAFWSILLRDKIGWWKRFFQDMVDLDLFSNDDPVLLEAMRFCFMRLLRKELKEIASDWNVHIISSSRYQGPRGRPDTMHFLPHLYNRQNLGTEVDNEEIDELYPSVTVELQDHSPEFGEFARTVLESAGYNSHVTDVGAALDLYFFLLMKIDEYS